MSNAEKRMLFESCELPRVLHLELDSSTTIEFILIRPGQFVIGESGPEIPVRLRAFGFLILAVGVIALIGSIAPPVIRAIKFRQWQYSLRGLALLLTGIACLLAAVSLLSAVQEKMEVANHAESIISLSIRQGLPVQPSQSVIVKKPFYIAKYEVSLAEFQATVKKRGKRVSNTFMMTRYGAAEEVPMIYVSWLEADQFCQIISEEFGYVCRLPTEVEWEYACRGGTQTLYSFGNATEELGDYAWWTESSWAPRGPKPRGQKRANAWNLHDMHGNVWEWCQNTPYNYSDGMTGSTTSERARTARGGAWNSGYLECASSFRARFPEDYKDDTIGFRPIIEIPDEAGFQEPKIRYKNRK